MSSNVTMLNWKIFHDIWWYQNSHQVRVIKCREKCFNLTWWHFMTYDDIWWHFHDIWWFFREKTMSFIIICHDMSRQIIKWLHQRLVLLGEKNNLYMVLLKLLPHGHSAFAQQLWMYCWQSDGIFELLICLVMLHLEPIFYFHRRTPSQMPWLQQLHAHWK